MFYAKLKEDGTLDRYPYTLTDLRFDNRNTSFPKDISDEVAASFGVVPVQPTPQPEPSITVNLERTAELQDGTWVEVWIETPATAEEIAEREAAEAIAAVRRCDYQAFWDALLISPVYQSIRAQSIQSLAVNTCCTEFIAAMTDAKIGRPNPNAIQACIWLLMAELTLDADEVAELQGLLADAQMDGVYSLQQA